MVRTKHAENNSILKKQKKTITVFTPDDVLLAIHSSAMPGTGVDTTFPSVIARLVDRVSLASLRSPANIDSCDGLLKF